MKEIKFGTDDDVYDQLKEIATRQGCEKLVEIMGTVVGLFLWADKYDQKGDGIVVINDKNEAVEILELWEEEDDGEEAP